MKHRGIENILLRRVRRHQSMTALFRAPDMDPRKPPQPRPVLQQEEQDSLVNISIPTIPPRSGTVARQVVSPSAATPQAPTAQTSAPAPGEASKTPDPVWKRLQTIFRKHQENNDSHATDMEASPADPLRPQAAYEEKAPEASQTISMENPSLPAQNSTAAIPSTRAVQRSPEKSEPASPNVPRKVESFPSTNLETHESVVAHSTDFKPTLPDKAAEDNDRMSTNNEPEKPSLPLETVWNVQRVEAPHPLFGENAPQPTFDSTDVTENEASMKISQASEQKPSLETVQLRREDDQFAETRISDSLAASEPGGESREPVEVLSPSRPRPPQVDLPSSRVSIQRQSQERHASKEVSEASPVDTAIGPLPADLWWLLGQKPPTDTPTSQPDIQRTIDPDQKQAPLEQDNIANPHTATEHPAEATPAPGTIQRQALPKDPLPASPARAEETKHAQPDLDDLARRVYAEVRRRLAAEWERRR